MGSQRNAILACCSILFTSPFPSLAQEPSPQEPSSQVEVVPPARAQELLRALIPAKTKSVKVDTYVAGTNVQDINLGMHCSSSSHGSTSGTVDDSGNINTNTTTHGSTNCSEQHIYKYTMYLGFEDSTNPDAGYMVTVQCQRKWVWNHCDMPSEKTVYPIVLEAGKHGTFKVYAATAKQLGGKTKVAQFIVLDVSHVSKKLKN